MKTTTTEFPVDPGTVVDVTCTYPEAVNKGSSQITCTHYTDYSYDVEPSCEIPGMQFISGINSRIHVISDHDSC